ncbi:hypothetical protein EPIR_2076 [Erwinia piriflorinigrans CFBP 5888]|uniref:Uncharacterized protein n=1 Tax=Erwinia piriflorinigrans CFBP 5888 TaxID=1161919 RepID=V5Z8U5_9GAMM|nr:hypothetical protein EPIR_2076 [Erwinia piriflorinigrans CFBP 5888]
MLLIEAERAEDGEWPASDRECSGWDKGDEFMI